MEKGGLVKILRGTEGGVELVADLDNVTLYDVIETIDNKRKISSCMIPGYKCEWESKHGSCYVHKNLLTMQDEMNDLLKSKPISSIISEN
jgi:DNA-binding IscR family transcriptional regulator